MPKPFELSDEFYIAIGKITIAWAMVEIPMDAIVGMVFTRTSGREFSPQIPRSFSKKAKFLDQCAKKVSTIAPFKESILELTEEMRRLSVDRQRLVHGIVDNFTPVDDDAILIRHMRYESDRHLVEEHKTSLAKIDITINDLIFVGSFANMLANKMANYFDIGPE